MSNSSFIGKHSRSRRDGFTLIEISVVVVLLGLLLGVAINSLRGPYDLALQHDYRKQLAHLDAFARSYAARHHVATTLKFDTVEGEIKVLAERDGRANQLAFLALGSQLQLSRVLCRNSSESKTQIVHVGSLGMTETYAIELSTDTGDSEWIVVLGPSGQRLTVESRYEVQQLLQTAATQRIDSN